MSQNNSTMSDARVLDAVDYVRRAAAAVGHGQFRTSQTQLDISVNLAKSSPC